MSKPHTLAIFDLDNTLLVGDSDHAWGDFLIKEGLVDPIEHKRSNDQFYQDYCEGKLDIWAYQAFALSTIKGQTPEALAPLHQKFMTRFIEPMIGQPALALINEHKAKGHDLLIITATNDFVTAPIAKRLGIDELIGSQAEIIDGRYTGQIAGTPSFQKGKITRLNAWLNDKDYDLSETYFYSDSHNDIPLLEYVGKPIAVDPDTQLQQHAHEKGWPVISLR